MRETPSKLATEQHLFEQYLEDRFTGEKIPLVNQQLVLIPAVGCKACIIECWAIFEDEAYSDVVIITDNNMRFVENCPVKNKILSEKGAGENTFNDLIFFEIYPVFLEFNSEAQLVLIEHLKPGNEAFFKSKLWSK